MGRRALLLAAPLAAAAAAFAQPFPPEPEDARREVHGWTIEHAGEDDGGRIVRMSRTAGTLRLSYQAVFWRGNHGIYMRAAAERRGIACGSDDWSQQWGRALPAEAVRARFASALDECEAAPQAASAALHGFENAYALAAAWVAEAEALTQAEIQAIIDYPDASANVSAGDPD
jgi:hypothetical protein